MKSDNVSALSIAFQLEASGQGPGIFARELALIIGNSESRPEFVTHAPGVANVWPDALSRLSQPDKWHTVPEKLRAVPRTHLPKRGESFYLTLVKLEVSS